MARNHNTHLLLANRSISRAQGLVVAGGVAVAGIVLVVVLFAAGAPAAFEAEVGTLAGSATRVALTGASGGEVVRFGVTVTPTPAPTPTPSGALTAQDLVTISGRKIFFGHQSVGDNILSGIPQVFSSYGVASPPIIASTAIAGRQGGYIAGAYVGQNTQPYLKISDFNAKIRGGIGSQVNIAFFKFCFVDIGASTDAQALFNNYRTTMTALARDYPNVIFLHTTAALTTNDAADNAGRERYNALLRQEYGYTGRLYDLAAAESTTPSGSRVSGTYNGSTYYSIYPSYSSDGGHLNATGSQAAAKSLLTTIARLVR